jgi:hypothetical protein
MRIPSSQSDMEECYEDLQPWFFKNDFEQFYDDPAPSEDIWKKFELMITPPRSPNREGDYLIPAGLLLPDLNKVSYLLNDDVSKTKLDFVGSDSQNGSPSSSDDEEEMQKAVIQDCMWSGLHVPKDLAVGQLSLTSKGVYGSVLDITSSECVDPTAVFPYPLNTSSRQEQAISLGTETPSDSDDDDDEEEDEEEIIDVVTVAEKCQRQKSSNCLPAAASMSAQVAAMHNYTQPRHTPLIVRQSNPSVRHSPASVRTRSPARSVVCKRPRQTATGDTGGGPPAHKKPRINIQHHSGDLKSVVHKMKLNSPHSSRPSSRNSSDSEEGGEGKRAQHNVLERKRRNDLKSSFFRLRDHIPELNAQERAAKVVILRKATDYILNLRTTEESLMRELECQQQVHERLKRKLSALMKS